MKSLDLEIEKRKLINIHERNHRIKNNVKEEVIKINENL